MEEVMENFESHSNGYRNRAVSKRPSNSMPSWKQKLRRLQNGMEFHSKTGADGTT